jgi:hypothetical protein
LAALYGATTIAGGKGERQPSKLELDGARHQGALIAKTAGKPRGVNGRVPPFLGRIQTDQGRPMLFSSRSRAGGGSVASQSECSICCSAIAIVQGCCLFSQTELRGFSKSGSANMPTATAISSGRCSGSQKTVPPHSGQKLNVTVLPLSARRAYRLAMPLASRTCSRG